MALVTWSLQVRGRLRPRATLVDGDGQTLARVVRDGRVRSMRAGGAKDCDGRTWRVVGPSDSLRVSCDGQERATVDDGVLEVGDQAYGWRLAEDGSRTLRVTSAAGGGTVMRAYPGDGDAWARFAFDDDLPEPFAVALAASVRLLEAEDPLFGPGRAGTGGEGREAGGSGVGGRRRADRSGGTGTRGSGAVDGSGGPGSGGEQDGDDAPAGGPAPESGHGVPPSDVAAPAGVVWALFVVGRARPRVLLSDGGDEALATIELRGGAPGTLGRATDRDGRRWVAELDGGVVTMRCAGRAMARAEGEELTVAGRTYPWRASLEGERTASLTGNDGETLLQVEPGPGGDGAWITIVLSDHLPSPLAVTLATCFVLLRVDALGRRG